jgi:DNA-directed RNA polymerase specialized sigma24 family protein
MIESPPCEDSVLLQAIERVRQGDSDAFEVIYHNCFAKVQRLCRFRLRWKDRCIYFEEDLASDIMTSIWKSLCDPRTEWSTSNNLWQAIHRLVFEGCINRARHNNRKKRHNELELRVLYQALYGHRIWAIGAAEVEAKDLIETLLEKLLDEEQTQFVECKLSGLTNHQIASRWQVNVRTVQRTMESVRLLYETEVTVRVES